MLDLRPSLTRRAALRGLGAILVVPSCFAVPLDEAAASAERGVGSLVTLQSADGAFRSTTYGLLAVGDTLTALAALALSGFPTPEAVRARDRALDHLEARLHRGIPALGIEGQRVEYPVYASALALAAFRRSRTGSPAIPLLISWLRAAQFGPEWAESPAFGGFPMGGIQAPIPPFPGHVDLSMTRRALVALPPDPAVSARARVFLDRCRRGEGAVYSPVSEPLNKGERDGEGRSRAYGTPTADFALAALAIGVSPQDPSISPAVGWLHRHVGDAENPGVRSGPVPDYAGAMVLLWLSSLAEFLRACPPPAPQSGSDGLSRVAGAIVRLQGADGLWRNPSGQQKEDDPIVGTSLALIGLSRSS